MQRALSRAGFQNQWFEPKENGASSFSEKVALRLGVTFKCCCCNWHIKSTDIALCLVQNPTDLWDSKWPQLYKYNYIFASVQK